MVYDIAEIRKCAKRISEVADDLNSEVNREFRHMRDTLFPEFRGNAANAVSDMISMLQSDGDGIVRNIRSISSQLSAFAMRLEKADEDAKRQVQSQR
ncbi:hypothetical protein FACS1894184_05080 [Clostridia bacterium]|nr:hypothetical protein FACS1894184_05080 [Clostridia bacterium]